MITKFKIFESNDPSFSWLLGRWLEKIKPPQDALKRERSFYVSTSHYQRGQKGYSVALFHKEKNFLPLFTIQLRAVLDKKQRPTKKNDFSHPTKMKIVFDCHFHNYITDLSDKELVENLKDFMIDTFTRYSYFHKKNPTWSNYSNWVYIYDFYINISDIENIMRDLENNLQLYIDSKKYNL